MDLTDRVVPVVVADDLTGATDTAVQFARTGWEIELLLSPAASGAAGSAFAVTSDVRALAPAAAQEGTRAAVADALSRAPRAHVYLKIDSTMRGPVAAQIAGALEAWRDGHPDALAVLCPAYPELGRTVADGVLRVDGVPVAETALRHDPVSPMTASDLAALVPGALPLAEPGESPERAVSPVGSPTPLPRAASSSPTPAPGPTSRRWAAPSPATRGSSRWAPPASRSSSAAAGIPTPSRHPSCSRNARAARARCCRCRR